MNIFDIGIILFIIMSMIVCAKKGLIKSAVSLVGIILVFIIALTFKEQLGNFLCKYLPFFNFSGNLEGLVSINILIYQLLAFIIIIAILLSIYALIMSISGLLQKIVNATIILKLPSAIAGSIIGLIEGYILTFIILLLLVLPCKNFDLFNDSKLVNTILYKTPIISEKSSNITNSISDIYTIADKVVNKRIDTNTANLEIIDAMIKYDVTNVHTIKQLVVLDKLKSVKGVDKVIKKYK